MLLNVVAMKERSESVEVISGDLMQTQRAVGQFIFEESRNRHRNSTQFGIHLESSAAD